MCVSGGRGLWGRREWKGVKDLLVDGLIILDRLYETPGLSVVEFAAGELGGVDVRDEGENPCCWDLCSS